MTITYVNYLGWVAGELSGLSLVLAHIVSIEDS